MKLYTFFEKMMAKNLEGKNVHSSKADATMIKSYQMKPLRNECCNLFLSKRSTPGCTTEGQEFRDSYKKFKK